MDNRSAIDDIAFVFKQFDVSRVLGDLSGTEDLDDVALLQIVEEAARFSREVLAPLNASGDQEGCRFDGDKVWTPAGFRAAYEAYCAAGWPSLPCDPAYGGQGLPIVLQTALQELSAGANLAWTMYPGLLHGAYECLHAHASDALRDRWLPAIVSGDCLATMCLTEPGAGSDLGAVRTRAVKVSETEALIDGSKIFISGGDQDLTHDILHLTLARFGDAPPGSAGLSLFAVPKYLDDGSKNGVACIGIEHKMGIRASATCTMQFAGARGFLVGAPSRGLQAMFTMMNSARLHVGASGLGLAQAAYDRALAYANERVQSRVIGRADEREATIGAHPAVWRLLEGQRVGLQGCRMLAYFTALKVDESHRGSSASIRADADADAALLTPIVKVLLTEQGFKGASAALQVFGGHGYIEETGIAQYLRDSRVPMLYEGTNEIHGVDFIARKISRDAGATLLRLLTKVRRNIEEPDMNAVSDAMRADALKVVCELEKLLPEIARRSVRRMQDILCVADEILHLVGGVLMAGLWCQAARSDTTGTAYKRAGASFYFTYLFPECERLMRVVCNQLRIASAGTDVGRDLGPSNDFCEERINA